MELHTEVRTTPNENRINERIPKTDLMRVVIIGGGFAGIELVRQLSKSNVQIVLIDKHNYHTFIPLLYQVATAGLSPGDISSPLRQFLRDNKNFHFRMAKVLEINAPDKVISTNLGKLSYDILIMASGSRTNFFGNKQIKKNANNLREITDAIELRTKLINNFEDALQVDDENELQKHMNIVIVGAGPTGVELAGAIGELRNQVLPQDYPELDFRKMNITLVEGGKQVLGAMSEKAGNKAAGYLKKFGIEVKLGTILKSYDKSMAVLSDETVIETKCLIWAAGVQGNLVPGLYENAVVNGRIQVDEFNLIEGHKYIYAVGDVALQYDNKHPKGLPMLAPVAIQQAKHLAENIKRQKENKPMKPFKYVDKGTMATIGRNKAVIDLPFNITIGGFFGWFIWMFIHLFSIIGFRRKLLVFSNWIWNYFTYNQGNRLIIKKDIDD
ncbi:MAG: NAD(P)/FAD-dependent oxidoreductase [Cyclobacteriaceae bacterium]